MVGCSFPPTICSDPQRIIHPQPYLWLPTMLSGVATCLSLAHGMELDVNYLCPSRSSKCSARLTSLARRSETAWPRRLPLEPGSWNETRRAEQSPAEPSLTTGLWARSKYLLIWGFLVTAIKANAQIIQQQELSAHTLSKVTEARREAAQWSGHPCWLRDQEGPVRALVHPFTLGDF